MAYKVPPAWLERQKDVLQRHLQGHDHTQVAAAINVSVDQYKRYIGGITMLPPVLVTPLARAYGVPACQLAQELGIVADDVATGADLRPEIDFRAEFIKRGMPPEQADEEIRITHTLTPEARRGWLLGVIHRLDRSDSKKVAPPRRQTRRPSRKTGTG